MAPGYEQAIGTACRNVNRRFNVTCNGVKRGLSRYFTGVVAGLPFSMT